jgi:hypothetical protein
MTPSFIKRYLWSALEGADVVVPTLCLACVRTFANIISLENVMLGNVFLLLRTGKPTTQLNR